jgi:hypothetical protein
MSSSRLIAPTGDGRGKGRFMYSLPLGMPPLGLFRRTYIGNTHRDST